MEVLPTRQSGKLLTPELTRHFLDEGIVFPLRVLSADEAHAYHRECDLLEAQLGGRPRTVEVRQMHLHFPWAYRLATEPRVLDAVEDLLGPDLLVWATELFAKHPDDRVISIGWHRDGAYMRLEASQTVTAWIALSPSNAEKIRSWPRRSWTSSLTTWLASRLVNKSAVRAVANTMGLPPMHRDCP